MFRLLMILSALAALIGFARIAHADEYLKCTPQAINPAGHPGMHSPLKPHRDPGGQQLPPGGIVVQQTWPGEQQAPWQHV